MHVYALTLPFSLAPSCVLSPLSLLASLAAIGGYTGCPGRIMHSGISRSYFPLVGRWLDRSAEREEISAVCIYVYVYIYYFVIV